jgi:hypothetical protein
LLAYLEIRKELIIAYKTDLDLLETENSPRLPILFYAGLVCPKVEELHARGGRRRRPPAKFETSSEVANASRRPSIVSIAFPARSVRRRSGTVYWQPPLKDNVKHCAAYGADEQIKHDAPHVN